MASAAWFPDQIEGELAVLRKHVADNVTAFRRWYSDPEVARLARYQDAPMRPDEIDRFFQLRAMGTESLTMAIHDRETGRLIGSCAFSQVDGENGSAMYHITIGEKDMWGRGYGTEATQLMLDHAFGTLGLHRVALTVFEFNERAIRAYRNCGFVVEGRSRESIWRDGQWWDELAMSVLSTEWHERRNVARPRAGDVARAGDVPRAGDVQRAGDLARPDDVARAGSSASSAGAVRHGTTPPARAIR